ncbi:MAG: hypothetical protein KC933_03930 [Myxococcales bacterium]|nr:hypothetical protein [Myxococcales bacterium]MCB9649384.1 hypothetical protein [Deltaproteobacteria bacterium]
MTEAQGTPDFRGFWQWFADHHAEILEIMAGRRPGRVTDILDDALRSRNLSFVYEVTEGTFGGELTFTPEGDDNVAKVIDHFVAMAPSFDTWVVHSRRQQKPLNAALAFTKAVHGIDLTGLHLNVRNLHGQYHLQFIHRELAAADDDKRFAVAATFLDHALGEALSMSIIGSVDFKAQGDGIDMPLVLNQIIREAEDSLEEDVEQAS